MLDGGAGQLRFDFIVKPFFASSCALRRCGGFGAARVKARLEAGRFSGGIGSLAALVGQKVPQPAPLPPRRCAKLVMIRSVVRQFDWSAFAASLDGDRFFSLGGASGVSCWRATRVHHKWRLLWVQEASCERTGSVLHALFNESGERLHPAALIQRLTLREAGVQCLGAARDELIVRTIVAALMQTRRSPFYRRPVRGKRLCAGASSSLPAPVDIDCDEESSEEEFCLEWTRAELREARVASRQVHAPVPLALLGARHVGADDVVEHLPLFVEDGRTVAKDRATSVVRSVLDEWLRSEAGAQWRAERRSFLKDEGEFE